MNVKKLNNVIDREAAIQKTQRKDFILKKILAQVP
jgi:uncharacterized protein (DUF1778 family)